ncbi:hypothetical protein LUZ60_011206 [Juncus effusus]|nr:hypothetical protein LUZ60_011206 [Juncus effusus]
MGQASSRHRRERRRERRHHRSENFPPLHPSSSPVYHDAPSSFYDPQSYLEYHEIMNRPSSSSSTQVKPALENISTGDNQKPMTIKNLVNVDKLSVTIEIDEWDPDRHLVSFNFNASADGSFMIHYFAREEKNGKFSQVYSEMQISPKIPFKKGLHQKFKQNPGLGMDLGFFEFYELSNPIEENIYPLVIYAEAKSNGQLNSYKTVEATLAVIEKENEVPDCKFRVKVINQILWVDDVRYELQEIYGLDLSNKTNEEKECVICMCEEMDTVLLPCRHSCMCKGCAQEVKVQTNKCPICRKSIDAIMEIEIQEQAV